MKKKNSKSKAVSENKKLKKELTEKLVIAFTTVINKYGKTKKSKSTIEKFAKQLTKKVNLKSAPVPTEEVIAEIPAPVVKTKTPKKATAETTK